MLKSYFYLCVKQTTIAGPTDNDYKYFQFKRFKFG